MIRIFKHPIAPKSLERHTSWNENDVTVQLMSDQHNKCYLCERKLVTDFQVEHLKSRANHKEDAYNWRNLLCACSYCNGKKSNTSDGILNPLEKDVENIIFQKFDFPESKVLFRIKGEQTTEAELTIKLLESIFNGSGKSRKFKEQQMYDHAKSRITSFQGMCLSWLKTGTEQIRNAIIEDLDIKSEYLGFKYWIIRSNSRLLSEFGKYVVWNKI